MRKSIKNWGLQFFKFGIVGTASTAICVAVSYGFLFIFNRSTFFGMSLNTKIVFSSFLGFSISFINTYYWNSKLVFNKSCCNFSTKSFLKSYFCYFFTWAISIIVSTFATDLFSVPKFWLPLITLFITVPLNFLLNKFWAFR